MIFLGIDPGKGGGMAFIGSDRNDNPLVMKFENYQNSRVVGTLDDFAEHITAAALEKVHSMPAQGVKSVFSFGENFGWWRGVLEATDIDYELVTPQRWQTDLDCRTGGDKNVTKRLAQELFPDVKVTHAVADALLIAEWCRRKHEADVLTS